MNKNELKKLLALGETETLEFKQSPNKSFYETTSAFSQVSPSHTKAATMSELEIQLEK